ncbi:ATP-dependent zinc metalloprotease FtsH [Ignavibacteria bacterium]|nr:ATP-dependent zinc metalloprotease FtsH [Bacteroidota bacterium]
MGDANNSETQKKQPQPPRNNLGGGDSTMNKVLRSIMIWGTLFVVFIIAWMYLHGRQTQWWSVSYSEYMNFLNEGKITEAVIKKSQLNDYEFNGTLRSPETVMRDGREVKIQYFTTKLGVLDSRTEEAWATKGIRWKYEEGDSGWWSLLFSFLPWIGLLAISILIMRKMQGGGSTKGIFSFGKARVKLTTDHSGNRITFNDVAGADEAKYELQEIIEFLSDPTKFQRLGGKIPKGVLLLGPPGTGKTLLARAVAGEANVPFFSISGADFVEMFVGVGASRVRDLFEQAKKNAPCLVFIDEIDAVGRHRGAGLGGGHDEREQTLNQLLVEMDGFEQNAGIIIIAATNRPDVLDPALLRPGRFDRQVVVDRPDVKGREGILKVHTRNIPIAPDVDLAVLARGTPGLSGADLANLANEAALFAARRNSNFVTMDDFENAKDKILMGVERKSMVISEKEKEITAYHEMGHALAGKLLPYSDPVHKVTIIPRGRALGVTSYLPTEDQHTYSKEYIDAKIVTLLAGRAAEQIVFDQLTTGAGNDLERASSLARKMVCEWGMSDVIGPVTFANRHDEVFLGREISQPRDHSEETARVIDGEVRRILTEAMEKAYNLLKNNIELLHKTARVLLEREILDGEDLEKLIKGEELPPIIDRRKPGKGLAFAG